MTWSSPDLELYLDGEMDDATQAALCDALRGDPALRGRLAEIAATDARVLEALTAAAPRRGTAGGAWRWATAACAGLLVLAAVAVALLIGRTPGPSPLMTAGDDTPDATAPLVEDAAEGYRPVRVVVAVRLPPRGRDGAAETDAPPAAEPIAIAPRGEPESVDDAGERDDVADPQFPARFEAALARGGIREVSRLVAEASDADKAYGYRRIGELVLSSSADAVDLLDGMTPEQQVYVCRQWILGDQLLPVTFRRLHELSGNPEIAEPLRVVVSELAAHPRLHPWLRSYDLLGQG